MDTHSPSLSWTVKGHFLLSVAGKGDNSLLSRSIKMLWKQMCPVLTSPENKKLIASHCPAGLTFLTWWISPLGAPRATRGSTGTPKSIMECLSGSLHTFTDLSWNSLDFFCSRTKLGLTKCLVLAEVASEQFSAPGDFCPPAGSFLKTKTIK